MSAAIFPFAATGAGIAQSDKTQLDLGRKAIEDRTGCFLVDYSFAETDPIAASYKHDNRVYDVNRNKSIKEWVFAENISPTRVRLQHVLFGDTLDGKLMEGSMLKHTGEDWEYNAPFLYDFVGNSTWEVKSLKDMQDLWTRRVTNLDDGLRYQCVATWKSGREYADWSCSDLAPIPGRETRDMQRKDYNELQRTSSVVVYDRSWLEREDNIKIDDQAGSKTELVKEVGRTWYVRLPDSECSQARSFVKERLAFWKIVREAWDSVLTGDSTFVELEAKKGQPSRYDQIQELEQDYIHRDLKSPGVREEARAAVLKVINDWRQK